MPEGLPTFRYHPDPLRSGSVVPSEGAVCKSCGLARGFVYTGPVYAERDGLEDSICPWCIADGSAAEKFEASFVDVEAIVGEVPEEVQREIERRTPGYVALQDGAWRACCGDGAAFVMPVTEKDLMSREFPRSRSALMTHLITDEDMDSADASEFVKTLANDSGHAAYMFKCLKCGKFQFHVEIE